VSLAFAVVLAKNSFRSCLDRDFEQLQSSIKTKEKTIIKKFSFPFEEKIGIDKKNPNNRF